ncbi:uncharacterized protein LOC112687593 [Sipha flava]|uniref:Uncharacterized protein LOC112687593 n=1 Tax=Sipha flava TaxID=143950 RepID=A0A8B8G068_9HEMI|nr:uncharacterized protein LOC112687593 [Sipha flava]
MVAMKCILNVSIKMRTLILVIIRLAFAFYSRPESYFSAAFRYIGRLFDSTNSDLRRGMPLMWWSFLPFTSDLQQTTIVSFYQEHMRRMKKGMFSDGGGNAMTNTRILPPGCPLHSPTDDTLPPLDTVYDNIIRRKPDDLTKRDPRRRNMLWHTFYQYFVLQFLDEDFNSTVTGSQLYGTDGTARGELRSFVGGKLRTERRLNDEHYPPRLTLIEKFISAFSRIRAGGPTHWVNIFAVLLPSRRGCGVL